MNNLEDIKKIIIEESEKVGKEVWFYPEYRGVKGFVGEQDIFLMGLNPSSGTFPSHKDKLLYNLLREKDLENIHITDLIKTRAKNSGVSKLITNTEFMKQQINFLKNEIDILKPKIIICMGSQSKNLLKYYAPEIFKHCKIVQILHYGFNRFHATSPYKSAEEVMNKISKQLDEINKEYKILE